MEEKGIQPKSSSQPTEDKPAEPAPIAQPQAPAEAPAPTPKPLLPELLIKDEKPKPKTPEKPKDEAGKQVKAAKAKDRDKAADAEVQAVLKTGNKISLADDPGALERPEEVAFHFQNHKAPIATKCNSGLFFYPAPYGAGLCKKFYIMV